MSLDLVDILPRFFAGSFMALIFMMSISFFLISWKASAQELTYVDVFKRTLKFPVILLMVFVPLIPVMFFLTPDSFVYKFSPPLAADFEASKGLPESYETKFSELIILAAVLMGALTYVMFMAALCAKALQAGSRFPGWGERIFKIIALPFRYDLPRWLIGGGVLLLMIYEMSGFFSTVNCAAFWKDDKERLRSCAESEIETGYGYWSHGKYSEAIARYSHATEADPANVDGHWYASFVLSTAPNDDVRDGALALKLAEAAAALSSEASTHEVKAYALAELGQYDEAAAEQREAIRLAKETGEANFVKHYEDGLRIILKGQPIRCTYWTC